MLIGNVIAKLRRKIGDTQLPYENEDIDLINFISDACDELQAVYPIEGFDVLVDEQEVSRELTNDEGSVVALQAYIIFKKAQKHRADSENFKMTKGKLSLDNTNQAKDHAQSIDDSELTLQKMFNAIVAKRKTQLYNNSKGVRVQSGEEV